MNRFLWTVAGVLFAIALDSGASLAQEAASLPLVRDNAFPISTQFSPVPSGKGWKSDTLPLTVEVRNETIHNIIEHGFSSLSTGAFGGGQAKDLLNYAQSLGMKIDYITNGLELFDRDHPPAISVYSPAYAAAVRKKVREALAPVKEIRRIHSVFPFMDEPFHHGPEMFDHSKEAQAVFEKRYGYAMPPNLEAVRDDPKQWLDLLNFQSNTFRDGWRQVYRIVKDFDPRPKVVMTHDSHSTFGAGVKSNSKVAMDDVFHWGGDFADIFIYDIYPYTMFDYRYGELGKLPKPRISQMHYTISQLRNVTTTYGKELAFWVGTYNKAWFRRFMGPEKQRQYWAERELAYTAVAQGANFLITGLKIPSDPAHWEDFGEGMRIIQKAGPGLLAAPKVKARACFLFPRTQYLQLQEEYYNVGLSFELFLRAFGELDILHEEQISDDKLNGYKVLVLCDVKLLPAAVAKHIEKFVREGGIVIADCVPQMDAYKQPLGSMLNLFGLSRAATGRIAREGQWVPFTILPPKMSFPPPAGQPKPAIITGRVTGHAFNQDYGFKVVSPRACEPTDGKMMLGMQSGAPALVRHKTGKGSAYLFGFCLQDSYFGTWKHNDTVARDQLRRLISEVFADAKVQSHIHSSNPDIEASVRAGSKEGYVFVINHEAADPATTVRLNDLAFKIGKVTDIENGNAVKFKKVKGGKGIEFEITVPLGETRLLRVSP